jgi:hypothetical protein
MDKPLREHLGTTRDGDWQLEREYPDGRRLRVQMGRHELERMVPPPPRVHGMNLETPLETEQRYKNVARRFLIGMIRNAERAEDRNEARRQAAGRGHRR